MSTSEHNNSLKSKHFLWVLGSLLTMVLCFILIWGFSSGWGEVKVSRAKFLYSNPKGDSGSYEGSYLLYQPLSATSEEPGHLIVMFHGGTSNAFAVKNYATEYARRGYVVITPDLPSTGYSDNIGTNTAQTIGPKSEDFLMVLQEHIMSLNFIDKENISTIGFSNGAVTAMTMGSLFPEVYTSCGNVTNYRDVNAEEVMALGIDYWGIQPYGSKDPAAMKKGGRDRTAEYAAGGYEVVKDYQEGVGSICYFTKSGYVHVLVPDSTEMVTAAITMQEMVHPTGSGIANDSLVFWFSEFAAAIGLGMMIVFIVNFCGLMMETRFFSSLQHPDCPVLAIPAATKPEKLKGTLRTLVEFAVFAGLYKVLGGKVVIPDSAFTPIWINNLLPYLLLLALYQFGKFCYWHVKGKKQGEGNFVDYGIAYQEGVKYTIINIGKAFLLSMIVIVLVFGLIEYMNTNLGVNYQFMVFTMSSLPLKKVAATPAYIVFYTIIFLGAHVTAYGCGRIKDNSNSWWGTFGNAMKGAAITIGPILLWCFLNYLTWKELIGLPTDIVADRLYGYILIVFIIAPLHAFLYKKTRSIWLGVFICAAMMTFMVCANYPLSYTYFG